MLDVTVLEALPQKLTGKVALVTGSARGLGRAYAIRLARLGADVVVNDVNLQANREYDEPLTPGCETVADEIRALDRRALAIQADVTDEAQVRAWWRRSSPPWGRWTSWSATPGGRWCGELAGQRDGHRRLQAHAGHQPHRHHPGLPGGGAGDEGPAPGQDRHRRLPGRAALAGRRRRHLLLRGQGGDPPLHPQAGVRAGPVQRDGERHRPRLDPLLAGRRQRAGVARDRGSDWRGRSR